MNLYYKEAILSLTMVFASLLEFFDLKTRRKGLFQFFGLFTILYDQSIQVTRTSDFEFDVILVLLNLDRFGILPASG